MWYYWPPKRSLPSYAIVRGMLAVTGHICPVPVREMEAAGLAARHGAWVGGLGLARTFVVSESKEVKKGDQGKRGNDTYKLVSPRATFSSLPQHHRVVSIIPWHGLCIIRLYFSFNIFFIHFLAPKLGSFKQNVGWRLSCHCWSHAVKLNAGADPGILKGSCSQSVP